MEKIIKGYSVLFDKEDLPLIEKYNWFIHKVGSYFRVCYDKNNKRIYLHRLILNIENSKILIDHINGNPLDNRRSNLRISDKSTNGMNRPKNKNNKVGYKGVSIDKKRNLYSVELMVRGVRYRKHGFKTAKEAAKKYNELAIEHHGEFARLNEIEES